MDRVIKVGIVGLGSAARQRLPQLKQIPDVRLTAVADLREEVLTEFRERFACATFTSVEEMCRYGEVGVVCVCTPNMLHAEHTIVAAEYGKHVTCEKPMAVTLEQAQSMIDAVERNGVKYAQGHSKVYTLPVRRMREIVRSGEIGRLIQVNNWYYNDWLHRGRLPGEVDSSIGGGVIYRQGPHQTDVVRAVGGGMVKSVRAITGRWDPNFPQADGNYTAFLQFEDGAAATMVMTGYAYFNSEELTWGIGESGQQGDPLTGRDRQTAPIAPEVKYGRQRDREERSGREFQQIYGLTIASCERGDLRQSPTGLYVYDEEGRREIPLDTNYEWEGLQEVCAAVREERDPFPDAHWGMATLEVILAIMRSSKEGCEVELTHQVPCPY